MDSGATITISGNKKNFIFLEPCNIIVECANNERMNCKLHGPLVITHKGHEIVMANSLYIPGCVTLLSVNQMTDIDFIVMFAKDHVEIFKSRSDVQNNKPYIRTEKKLGAKLWTVPVKGCTPYHGNKVKFTAFMAKFCNDANPDVVHARYCHLNLGYLRKKFPLFTNIEKLCWCDACASEAPRKPYMKKYKPKVSTSYSFTNTTNAKAKDSTNPTNPQANVLSMTSMNSAKDSINSMTSVKDSMKSPPQDSMTSMNSAKDSMTSMTSVKDSMKSPTQDPTTLPSRKRSML